MRRHDDRQSCEWGSMTKLQFELPASRIQRLGWVLQLLGVQADLGEEEVRPVRAGTVLPRCFRAKWPRWPEIRVEAVAPIW
jgi:hypothetical protein